MARKTVDIDIVREIALALPDVKDASTDRGPAFKLRGRLLTCAAIHSSAEEGSLMVRVDPNLRAELLASEPDAYYLTPHYEDYAVVLVRLARVSRAALTKLLQSAVLLVDSEAPKRRTRAAKRATAKRPG